MGGDGRSEGAILLEKRSSLLRRMVENERRGIREEREVEEEEEEEEGESKSIE